MIKSIDRKHIRANARNLIKLKLDTIILLTLSLFVFAIICALLSNTLPSISLIISVVYLFTIISGSIIALKMYRKETIALKDAILVYRKDNVLRYILASILKYGIVSVTVVPFGLLYVLFIKSAQNTINEFTLRGNFSFIAMQTQIENIIYTLAVKLAIFIIIAIVIYVVFYFLCIFLKFVFYAVYDTKKEINVLSVFVYTYKLCRKNKLSYFLMSAHFFLITLVVYVIGIGLGGILIANGLFSLLGILLIVFIFVNFLLVAYNELSFAGYYNKLVSDKKEEELSIKMLNNKAMVSLADSTENVVKHIIDSKKEEVPLLTVKKAYMPKKIDDSVRKRNRRRRLK